MERILEPSFFAAPEGSIYPDYFSSEIPERAIGATGHDVMRKLHDRVSLYKSIKASYIYLTHFQLSILDKLYLIKIPLKVIIAELIQDAYYV